MSTRQTVKISAIAILISFLCAGAVQAEDSKPKFFWQGRKEKRQEFKNQKREENRAFRQGLQGKSPEERRTAMLQHRQEMQGQRKNFHEKMRGEKDAALKAKLDKNPNMTEEQKKQILDQHQKQYEDNSAFYAKQAADNQVFLKTTANDSSLTKEQKQEAIRKHFEEQRQANKAHWQEQKEKRKELLGGVTAAAHPA